MLGQRDWQRNTDGGVCLAANFGKDGVISPCPRQTPMRACTP